MNDCDILFLIRSMGRGGAERQLSLLARRLHASGYRVAVAMFYAEGALLSELTDVGVPVIDLKKRGRWSFLGVARRLMRFIASHKPRVVHGYMPAENSLAILLRPWIRRYGGTVACGIRIAKFDPSSYGVAMRAVYALQRLLLPHADRVISNSADALDELRGRIGAGRGYAVPNGVETARFAPVATQRVAQRGAWAIADGEIAIGIIGRLDPQKNHRLMIAALHRLAVARPEVRLIVVGGGSADYEAALRDEARVLGVADRIVWAGAVDDMAAVYAAIDILCLPSVSEGFPNVVAEAMSVGLPCVATDVGDSALVVGDAGWVVPSNDVDALAAALDDAVARLPSWDRAVPRRRIADEFGETALMQRTLAALRPFIE